MFKARVAILCLLLTGCGWFEKDNEPHETNAPGHEHKEHLMAQASLYCAESQAEFDLKGHVYEPGDSILFTTIWAIGCRRAIDITQWEEAPGLFNRAPKKAGHVVAGDGRADSSFSKDMAVGLLTYLEHTKNLAALERVIAYGEGHDWVMCSSWDSDITMASKCRWSYGLIRLAYDLRDKLKSMPVAVPEPGVDPDQDPEQQKLTGTVPVILPHGFEAHLQVQTVLLRGRVHGAINDVDLSKLKGQAERQPRNGIYQAAWAIYRDGNHETAHASLHDQTLWPVDRLPNNHENFCANYLWQRDEDNSDWVPCPDREKRSFAGADFAYTVWMMWPEG